MTQTAGRITWSTRQLLSPFFWDGSRDVLVPIDLFASQIDDEFVDKVFAVMALCPQHRFHLVTSFPERFSDYVRKMTEDREEWLTWRVQASFVLSELGLGHEAKGHGPIWPLKNVVLAGFGRV